MSISKTSVPLIPSKDFGSSPFLEHGIFVEALSPKRERALPHRWYHKVPRTRYRGRPDGARSVSGKMNTLIGSATIDGKREIELLRDPSLNKSTAYTEVENQALDIVKPLLSRRRELCE